MSSLAYGIGVAEGYGEAGAIPTLANNPGDLENGDIGYGTMGDGITVYPTAAAGESALQNQIDLITSGNSANYSPDETLAQMGETYSGGDSNWAANVANALGLSTNTTIAQAASTTSAANSSSGLNMSGFMSSLNSLFGTDADASAVASSATEANPVTSVASSITNSAVSDILTSRVGAFIVGIICIGVGLMMFRTTQTVIKTAGKVAASAAEV